MYDACSKWFEIGVQLGIKHGKLKEIEKNHLGDCGQCLTTLLSTWLYDVDPIPTWKALADALRSRPVQVKVVSKREKGMTAVMASTQ